MRRPWLLASAIPIALPSWQAATAEAPSSTWLMYKNPEDAGFSLSAIRRIKDYCSRFLVEDIFEVIRLEQPRPGETGTLAVLGRTK